MGCQFLSKPVKSVAAVNYLFCLYRAARAVLLKCIKRINLQFGSFSMVSGNVSLIAETITDFYCG